MLQNHELVFHDQSPYVIEEALRCKYCDEGTFQEHIAIGSGYPLE